MEELLWKKVWTIDAKDVEYIQCEHVNKPGYILQLEAQIQELEKVQDKHLNNDKLDELKEKLSKERDSRKFNLEPEKFSPEVNVKHFCTSFKKQQKVDTNLRNQIITTRGDADVMVGTKHIDPALCIYHGAHLICIDNKHLNSKTPRGNGTLCRVLGVKLKQSAPTYMWKNYYGKSVDSGCKRCGIYTV